jgi:hypothetical protein
MLLIIRISVGYYERTEGVNFNGKPSSGATFSRCSILLHYYHFASDGKGLGSCISLVGISYQFTQPVALANSVQCQHTFVKLFN